MSPSLHPAGASRHRTIFYLSDGTGITAEALGKSLLTQFATVEIHHVRIPFVGSTAQAHAAKDRIDQQALNDQQRPVVFSTLVDSAMRNIVRQADCRFFDLFSVFVEPLEVELGMRATRTIGRLHKVQDSEAYGRRIDAINFSLSHDDGQTDSGLEQADIILVGVSRCGKTPTSLYLAMQHGLRTANYPLVEEDFERRKLPAALYNLREKLFGLSISPERLSEIRRERRPDSRYCSIENCRHEVREAENLMQREGIPWLSSTAKSIEEIATTVLQIMEMQESGVKISAGPISYPQGL